MQGKVVPIYNIAPFVSLAIALLALIFQIADYHRNGASSFRRVTGGLLVLLGCFAGIAASLLLLHQTRVASIPEVFKAGAAAVAVALVLTGLVVAVRAPLTQEEQGLRILARAIYDSVTPRTDTAEVDGHPFVRRSGTLGDAGWRMSLDRLLRHQDKKLAVLYGEPSAGKSVGLRGFASKTGARAIQQRRPRLIAVYIDLAKLRPSLPLTTDVLRNYIRTTISTDDSALLSRLETVFQEAPDKPKWVFLFDSVDEFLGLQNAQGDQITLTELLSVIRRFLDTAICFHALVATSYPPSNQTFPESRIWLSPLSAKQQMHFARQVGLSSQARSTLRHWTRQDRKLAAAANNPMLLKLLCDFLGTNPTPQLPIQHYQVVDAAISARLRALNVTPTDQLRVPLQNESHGI